MNYTRFATKQFPIVALALSIFSLVSCSKDDAPAPVVNSTATFSYTSARKFPVTVNFMNTSSDIGTPGFSYSWDFGDGNTSALQNPTHVYNTPGYYMITLYENSASGSGSGSNVLDLSSEGPSGNSVGRPGSLNFNYSIDEEFIVTFTNTSLNATSSTWDFGDGTQATNPGNSFTHTYQGGSTYTVLLTTTGTGSTDNTTAVLNFN